MLHDMNNNILPGLFLVGAILHGQLVSLLYVRVGCQARCLLISLLRLMESCYPLFSKSITLYSLY
jgi:hypothetical protein